LQPRLNNSVYATLAYSTARADWDAFDSSPNLAHADLQREISAVADAEGLDSFVVSLSSKVTEAMSQIFGTENENGIEVT
jgi:hypothetical protein